ncbi:SixA phosphatase family protein [Algibacter mikhailovii]|uniref:Phosphoglycerate mutase n=1 Tax=Algibacter mikhailovii TaxID=425498 RepID=A0A918QUD4_9FLAO|nr:histidine phosphatase family protein [Algibacter mikhailovii]GGZ70662.1 phosphoglycerate mutase [Algibacter mikhailovii]
MKRLILIRHAKSSWNFDVIDHQRPLNKRGLNDADLVSTYLVESNPKIDILLCSDAQRTRLTADFFISKLSIDSDQIVFNHDLYDFDGRSLENVIKNCDPSTNNLMVFGHNHAITFFVNKFGNKYVENVPTCGVVIINFDISDWSDLTKGETIQIIFPKQIK